MTEILYLTHNRREFTEASLAALLENTSARRINRIWFFDDRSSDGTQEFLRKQRFELQVPSELVAGSWDSPVAAMADFFVRVGSPLVAKIDSDTMLPPGWLEECELLMERYPEIDVLGIEARGASAAEAALGPCERWPDPSAWIGGIGVFRTASIRAAMERVPLVCDRAQGKWFGWQAFQERSGLRCAWIKPSLQMFLLDRMPLEPWRSLSEEYVRRGWQRPAPYLYGPEWAGLWRWWGAAQLG
jgi:cellulose synthase/poly-beta-1,6-N-acetylglucosamine synthase-like glycosyltransferase